MTEEQWQKLKTLYDRAQQLRPGERSVFLSQVCAGDEQLRRQLESLLEAGAKAEAQDFLEAPALAMHASWTGSRIAHYAVGDRIGAGGMGEVYRARDTKLGREVALKVLPPSFVQDANRRSRFEREARLLAALNHPNIAAIYGFEQVGQNCALVLELVEGATLADRLKAGPIPIREALQIARQLADALEAAHEKEIVHRDLKPANIKITTNGVVKVLDFGLAKALGGSRIEDPSQLPTALTELSRTEGAILGTPAYMSPEQAAGQSESLDTRTDVWAFGCVLYEMLTGRLPFAGNSVSEMLGAILSREPDWDALPKAVPESIERLLHRCLAKDPKHRLHHIANARIELDETLSAITARARTPSTRTLRLIAGIAAALSVVTVAAYLFLHSLQSNAPVSEITERQITTNPVEDPIVYAAISPDGKYVAYNDSSAIRVRFIDTGDTRSISGASAGVPADFCFK